MLTAARKDLNSHSLTFYRYSFLSIECCMLDNLGSNEIKLKKKSKPKVLTYSLKKGAQVCNSEGRTLSNSITFQFLLEKSNFPAFETNKNIDSLSSAKLIFHSLNTVPKTRSKQ